MTNSLKLVKNKFFVKKMKINKNKIIQKNINIKKFYL